jgi:hypothetical protein
MIDADALTTAIVRVAEESLFTWAEPVAVPPAEWPTGPWWHAAVAFTGPIAGRMDVAVPDALARELLSAFAGAEPGAPVAADQLADFVGEFANMSCGAWLTSLGRAQAFTLMPPVIGASECPPPGAPTAVVNITDVPVVVHASLA